MWGERDGIPINIKEAISYFKMKADKRNIAAMNSYTCMLNNNNNGILVKKKEIDFYYKMAAIKRRIAAMNNYALKFKKGDGIQIDKNEAVNMSYIYHLFIIT